MYCELLKKGGGKRRHFLFSSELILLISVVSYLYTHEMQKELQTKRKNFKIFLSPQILKNIIAQIKINFNKFF